MTEKRYEGMVEKSELERIKQQAKKMPEKRLKPKKWKHQHEQLVNAMQAVKKGGTGSEVQESPVDPSLVPCPHCARKFNPISAEKHIQICQRVFKRSTTRSARHGPKRVHVNIVK